MATAGKNASSAVSPAGPHAEGLGGGDRGQHEHELVGEADEEHVGGGDRLAAQPVEPEVHGAGEAPPAVASLEPPADPLVGHGVRGGCTAPSRVTKARPTATWVARPRCWRGGFTRKPATLMSGQHDPAGEALEHHRRERLGRLAGLLGTGGCTRSTSPPMVVGSTFDTNCPARL